MWLSCLPKLHLSTVPQFDITVFRVDTEMSKDFSCKEHLQEHPGCLQSLAFLDMRAAYVVALLITCSIINPSVYIYLCVYMCVCVLFCCVHGGRSP